MSVTAGSTVTSVNAALKSGGAISGRVTAATGGTDLSGICVDATSSADDSVGSAVTGVDGTYTVIGLPTGSYTVEFYTDDTDDYYGCGNSGNFLDQWYDNQASASSANPVSAPPIHRDVGQRRAADRWGHQRPGDRGHRWDRSERHLRGRRGQCR